MNNELHIAYQIKRHLNATARALPADMAERLRAAREQALARQKQSACASPAATAGTVDAPAGGVAALRGGEKGAGPSEWLGQLLPVALLACALIGISYWHQSNRAEENADIDTQMLVDELPPSAYADKGFVAWIKRGQE